MADVPYEPRRTGGLKPAGDSGYSDRLVAAKKRDDARAVDIAMRRGDIKDLSGPGSQAKDELSKEWTRLRNENKSDWIKYAKDKISKNTAESGEAGRTIPSYKKGGIVKKTGLAKLHKGEKVIPKNKVSRRGR